MAAAKLLIEKWPNMFWASCAAHIIDLMLEAIGKEVKLRRLADGDEKASMAFLYAELQQAKEAIKMAFKNVEINYRSIIEIIETRAKGWLDSPLHMTAYLLNPYNFYKDQSINDNVMVLDAIFICFERFFRDDIDKQDQVINMELPKYKEKGDFGRILAANGCSENSSSYDPCTWWMTYGNATPTLQKMFNSKLINKWERNKNQNRDVLRSLDTSKAQSWIVAINDDDEEMEESEGLEVGGEAIDNANQQARELHDDDFVSDEEQVECEEDFEFNSDEEGFVDINEDGY
ncbi:uncharacterized protein LOC128126130 [Lactuca sativa]|uniref:DUF659 domain-containing protein n=1 Tax=Lactuca sativa TaxID=4236 RepID=A0A9R1VF13_LACSA|nr:uncharacterized protein LOC128126130 [Lactuca sativa]KAJ0203580.1 hypothetical protein LSAT_V11C500286070 [Lactuca sativa]